MYNLIIYNKHTEYHPLIEGQVVWETVRMGNPGKLIFNVVKDENLKFEEGNVVVFRVDSKDIFFGYVFAKETSKDEIIKVTAYDQLRYFMNKEFYKHENKTASEILKKIIADFQLEAGKIDDTGYVIPSFIQDDKTLFDIVYDALDLTLINSGKLYVLFDDFGKLALKDVENMKVPDLVVGDERSQDYNFKTDIDSDTYNKIKLVHENDESGTRERYEVIDSSTIKQWGVLQYYEKVVDVSNVKHKADTLLKLKNRINKTLQLKDCLGDTRVRAGSSVMTLLTDLGVSQYMLVERCKHVFSNDEHFMTLDLRGAI